MIAGEEYKIHSLDSTNWTSIGSPINNTQSVFVKNSTSATGTGKVVEDFITYSEEKSSDTNRIVRFIAERPELSGAKSSGYSSYKARYRCKVNINNKQTLYSAP